MGFLSVWLENGDLWGETSTTGGTGASVSCAGPSTGAWHHVAFTYDYFPLNNAASVENLYVDGVLKATHLEPGPIAYDSHPLQFGADIELGSAGLFPGRRAG